MKKLALIFIASLLIIGGVSAISSGAKIASEVPPFPSGPAQTTN